MFLKTPILALTTALFLTLPAGAQDIPAEFASIAEAKTFAEGNGLILVMGNQSAFTLLTAAEYEAAKAADAFDSDKGKLGYAVEFA